ncbi:hypothetical protein GCM10007852_23900 [Agaribacter marinus]|uniref:Methyl-accepting chemotaxis protein n=2 Tax=Agaribacter marinus TaxID=1431249 RepID=A0AA37SYI8_9ALTE|nr:hypothetical protein GCM10007852_23900 [Agaribacter marinus]
MKFLNWLDNVKLSKKMSIIAILALIGLGLPTYYYSELSYKNQLSAEMELRGIPVASAVVKLKKYVALHRGTSAKLFNGNQAAVSAIESKSSKVDQQFTAIGQLINEAGGEETKDLLDGLNELNNRWNTIKSNVNSRNYTAIESFNVHSNLIVIADLYLGEVMNHFSLNYDTGAASHHLIVANLQDMPRLADAIGKVRGAGAGALSTSTIANGVKSTIRANISSIRTPLQDFKMNMAAASHADIRLRDGYSAASNFISSVDSALKMAERETLEKNSPTYDATQFFNEYTELLNTLYAQHDENMVKLTTIIAERKSAIAQDRITTLTIICILLGIISVIGFVVIRSIQVSTMSLIGHFIKISKGEYNIKFNVDRKDEMGILENELSKLNTQLQIAAKTSIEASRVKEALDNTSSCFMMADTNRNIVYMNHSVYKLLKEAESAIRKELPHFNVESLIGTNIDSFHVNPSHQHRILDKLEGKHEANLKLGGYIFKLIVNPIIDEGGNNLGHSVEWQDLTKIKEEERKVARILEALNCTTTNVMLADANRNIIYMNRSVRALMKQAESDLKKVLPHFDADTLIGANMDTFHKDPSHQKALLERLKKSYTSHIKVGPRHFRLVANPIFDSDGERLGYVVEWLERTKEVNAEQEIAEIVQASLEGNFEKRVNENDKEGFMLTMAQGLNQLMKTTESGLNEVSNVLLAISEGDLTKRINSDFKGTFNDLKNYCNTTNENLVSVISKIREASDTINNASSEIAQGNSDLSTRTEQQASSLEETASSMEELTSTVRLNAENANQANGLASQAVDVAGNGGALIQQVVTTMASINESAQKISDIIGVIDGIAFQTNILALNAAVEAARAGEQGRGFAVVASEVRTLAQRSANAAKDIKDLISDSVTKVESGNELVSQSGETMQEIVVAIQRVNDIMSEIAAASAEQASGIDEVSKAVSQMDEMTQQNAALVEEAAAAAESMRGQAGDLNSQVGTFKLDTKDVTTNIVKSSPDLLSQQFDELPSVASARPSTKAIPAISEEDEWESF